MKDLFLALLENWFERRRCVLGEDRLETIVISLRANVNCFSLSDEDMTPGRQLVICVVRSVVQVSIKAGADKEVCRRRVRDEGEHLARLAIPRRKDTFVLDDTIVRPR